MTSRFVCRVCPRCAPVFAVLAGRLSFVRACLCSSGTVFCLQFTPAVCLATNRTACDSLRSYSAGSRSPFARSRGVGAVSSLGWFTSGLCVSLGRSRRGYRSTENGERGTGNGAGGAAFVRLCAAALALKCFPRGVRWGCAPQTAPKSLRLSGLSSRCGGVMFVRIRAAVTRVQTKTRRTPIYGSAGRAVLRCYLYALSKTCQTPIYGLASRVALRGSKWKRAQPAGLTRAERSGVQGLSSCP